MCNIISVRCSVLGIALLYCEEQYIVIIWSCEANGAHYVCDVLQHHAGLNLGGGSD